MVASSISYFEKERDNRYTLTDVTAVQEVIQVFKPSSNLLINIC